MSHRAWQERLGGEIAIIGQEAVINGEPATIIGVMPDGFHYPYFQDIWVPLRLDVDQVERGQGPSLQVFGHLREDVTLELANTELDALGQRIAIDHPDTNEGIRAIVRPYALADRETVLLFWMMMVSALGVLLIACVNVANLLLARAAIRVSEMSGLNPMLDETATRQKKQIILNSQNSGNFSCAHNAVSTLTGDPPWTRKRSPASIRYTRKTLLR